jgi:hypothetical protein
VRSRTANERRNLLDGILRSGDLMQKNNVSQEESDRPFW